MWPTQWAIVCCSWQREFMEMAYERRTSPFAPSQLERSRGEDKRMWGKERWRLIAWLARLRLLSVFMPHLISDSEWPSCPVMQGPKSPLELKWTLDTAEKSTWRWSNILLMFMFCAGPEWRVPIRIRCAQEAGGRSEDLWAVAFEILRGLRMEEQPSCPNVSIPCYNEQRDKKKRYTVSYITSDALKQVLSALSQYDLILCLSIGYVSVFMPVSLGLQSNGPCWKSWVVCVPEICRIWQTA